MELIAADGDVGHDCIAGQIGTQDEDVCLTPSLCFSSLDTYALFTHTLFLVNPMGPEGEGHLHQGGAS